MYAVFQLLLGLIHWPLAQNTRLPGDRAHSAYTELIASVGTLPPWQVHCVFSRFCLGMCVNGPK